MRIVTWNVNRFDGVHDWFYAGDLEIAIRKKYANKILDKIKTLITDKNDIAILQEIPFEDSEMKEVWMKLLEKEKNLVVHSWFYEKGKKEGKREDLNYNSKHITVAITTSESDWKLRDFGNRVVKFNKTKGMYDYANRYIEMENRDMDISLLGMHVTMDNKEQWAQIHSAADNTKFTFIVGDYNINDLLNPSEENLRLLENNYKRMINNDIITNNQKLSSIDNIFVSKNSGFSIDNAQVAVIDYCFIYEEDEKKLGRKKVRCSDHNMCVCKLE